MRRLELALVSCPKLPWDELVAVLPRALEAIGLVHDDASTDGSVLLEDLMEGGTRLHFERATLARRAGSALAARAQKDLLVFELLAIQGTKRFTFKTHAWKATAKGELKPHEGKELDFDDPAQTWGGGTLLARAKIVLEEYAQLDQRPQRTLRLGFKKRSTGKPSTSRVATLLATLKKASHHEAVTQPDGRVELRITLATGGKQTSFCTAAEHEELEGLLS